jgi:hypothetical protein
LFAALVAGVNYPTTEGADVKPVPVDSRPNGGPEPVQAVLGVQNLHHNSSTSAKCSADRPQIDHVLINPASRNASHHRSKERESRDIPKGMNRAHCGCFHDRLNMML